MERHPDDTETMLYLAELHLAGDHPERADRWLRKAFSQGEPADRDRLTYLDRRIGHALERKRSQDLQRELDAARSLAREGRYEDAIDRYEQYFTLRGVRTRPLLAEMARVYGLAGDHAGAVSIYTALQARGYAPAVALEIARQRYLMLDHAGAIETLETLIARYPDNTDARTLLQQIYLEVQRFAQADTTLYTRIDRFAQNSTLNVSSSERLSQRINLVERAIDTDYVGLVVPVSQYIRARGSITRYEHWAQGLMTQVTMPAQPRPFVVTAGLVSHFIDGTRRLLPGTPTTLTRINQIIAGAFYDLTAPATGNNAGYTNRLWMQFGLFDYAGSRTTGFADIRYMKRSPGQFSASVGARTTEGTAALWSPAGGEFGLRLTQFDVRVRSMNVLPDSLLRVRVDFAANLIQGERDSTLARRARNAGTVLRMESSVRVFPYTYLGLSFHNINYRYTLDTFFSPNNYQAYDLWAEYEREMLGHWLLRSRLSAGLVSYRRGAFAARVETDLIYRFSSHLAFSLSGSAGTSVRFVDDDETLRDNRFRTLIFNGALYWTL